MKGHKARESELSLHRGVEIHMVMEKEESFERMGVASPSELTLGAFVEYTCDPFRGAHICVLIACEPGGSQGWREYLRFGRIWDTSCRKSQEGFKQFP